jgi:hypothetical protein
VSLQTPTRGEAAKLVVVTRNWCEAFAGRNWREWYANHPHAWAGDWAETWRVVGWYASRDLEASK